MRLGDHPEFRTALKLRAAPDYPTLYRFLRRWDNDTAQRNADHRH